MVPIYRFESNAHHKAGNPHAFLELLPPIPKCSDQCLSLVSFFFFPSQLLITIYLPPVPGGQALDPVHFPVCGEVEGLTPVPLCSTQVGSRRGSPLLCWSSRNCMGSWKTSTHSRRGRHWRTGRRRTQRGRHTCSFPGCCSRKQSHRHWDWSIHSHLRT